MVLETPKKGFILRLRGFIFSKCAKIAIFQRIPKMCERVFVLTQNLTQILRPIFIRVNKYSVPKKRTYDRFWELSTDGEKLWITSKGERMFAPKNERKIERKCDKFSPRGSCNIFFAAACESGARVNCSSAKISSVNFNQVIRPS